jgi:hypothetical protein
MTLRGAGPALVAWLSAAALVASCAGESTSGAGGAGGTAASSSSLDAASTTSSSGAGADPCSEARSCDDCGALEACGFCYQTGRCEPGDEGGPTEGSCPTWRPFADFDATCFGPIECDPRPPAASGPPCEGEGCYIVDSQAGTRCLPAGSKQPGEGCAIGDFSNVCVPGFVCDLNGSSTGACAQVCIVGDDGTCPPGGQCALFLGIVHGPYGVCR